MNLDWHIRLIERMIKINPDATIKDYLRIVGEDDLPIVTPAKAIFKVGHYETKVISGQEFKLRTYNPPFVSESKLAAERVNGYSKKRAFRNKKIFK